MFPTNNSTGGNMLTIKLGEASFDTFPAGSQGGTPIIYIASTISQAAAITYTGTKTIVITAISPSCFTAGNTYYMDVSAKIPGGFVAPITSNIKGTFTGTNQVTFNVTSAQSQQPGSGTTVFLEIFRK